VARKGAKRPIFEGNMPPKKCTPNIGADIGAITGILLNSTYYNFTNRVCTNNLFVAPSRFFDFQKKKKKS
jgi:hypothetical protein